MALQGQWHLLAVQVLVTVLILLFVSLVTIIIFLAMLKIHLLVSLSQRGNLRRVHIPRWYHDLDQPRWAEWVRQVVRWHPKKPLDVLPLGVPVVRPTAEQHHFSVSAVAAGRLPPPLPSGAEPCAHYLSRVGLRMQWPLSTPADAAAPTGFPFGSEQASDPEQLQLSLPTKRFRNKEVRTANHDYATQPTDSAAQWLEPLRDKFSAAGRVQHKHGLDLPSPIPEAPCNDSASDVSSASVKAVGWSDSRFLDDDSAC